MKYNIVRTDTADAGIRKMVLYIAQNFGRKTVLKKLEEIESEILKLGSDPYIGTTVSCFKKAGVPGAYFGKGFGIL